MEVTTLKAIFAANYLLIRQRDAGAQSSASGVPVLRFRVLRLRDRLTVPKSKEIN